MKTPIKYFTLVALVFLSQSNFGQTKMFGMGNEDITQNYKRYFVSYDYVNNVFDTVFAFPGTQSYLNTYNTIDPYNGRYFFIGSNSTLAGYRLFTIDLNTNVMTHSPPLSASNLGEITYDMYLNKLIFPYNDHIKTIDISTGVIQSLFQIPYNLSNNGGVYNIVDQLYVAFVYQPSNSYFAIIDIANKNVVDTTNVGVWLSKGMVFDITSKEFYSNIGNNGTIAKIDPFNFQQTIVGQVPGYTGWMNREQSVFDSNNGLYILQYGDVQAQTRTAVVNVSTGLVVNDNARPLMDFNRFNGNYRPSIKLNSNELTTTYGTAYQWYLNDSVIPLANNQKLIPQAEGIYKVNVTFMSGRKEFSDPFNYLATGIEENITPFENVLIYPNPTNDNLTISFSTLLPKASYKISITNVLGQTVLEKDIEFNGNSYSLQTSDLYPGIYQIRFENSLGLTTKQFVKN